VPPVDPAQPIDPALDPRPALSKHGCSLELGTWNLELTAALRLYQAAPEPQTAAASYHPIYASMAKNLLENQHFACKLPSRSASPIRVTWALRIRTVLLIMKRLIVISSDGATLVTFEWEADEWSSIHMHRILVSNAQMTKTFEF